MAHISWIAYYYVSRVTKSMLFCYYSWQSNQKLIFSENFTEQCITNEDKLGKTLVVNWVHFFIMVSFSLLKTLTKLCKAFTLCKNGIWCEDPKSTMKQWIFQLVKTHYLIRMMTSFSLSVRNFKEDETYHSKNSIT